MMIDEPVMKEVTPKIAASMITLGEALDDLEKKIRELTNKLESSVLEPVPSQKPDVVGKEPAPYGSALKVMIEMYTSRIRNDGEMLRDILSRLEV